MSLRKVLGLGALILRHGVTGRALPQIQPIVVSTNLGGGIGVGTATNLGGGVGLPQPSTSRSLTGAAISTGVAAGAATGVATGAQVGVPVPVVSFSTTTVSASPGVSRAPSNGTFPSITAPTVSSLNIPAGTTPTNIPVITGGALFPPQPISTGPLSPIVNPIAQGTLNIPIVQNTDIGALSTLISINLPGGQGGYAGSLPFPTGVSLPTTGLPVASATNGLGSITSAVTVTPNWVQEFGNIILGLFQAILQDQAASLVASATGAAASIPAVYASALPPIPTASVTGVSIPAVTPTAVSAPSANPLAIIQPGGPNIPAPSPSVPQVGTGVGALTTAISAGPNFPVPGIPASSLLSVTNVSALTASFPSLRPRAPQLGSIAGLIPTSAKVLTSTGTVLPVPASVPVGAVGALPTGVINSLNAPVVQSLAGSLPTSAVSSVSAGAVPALPVSGVPAGPTGAVPSLPTSVLPVGQAGSLPSLPTSGLPIVPVGVVPPLPTSGLPGGGVGAAPSLPITGIPSVPASGISLPTGTAIPSLPINATGIVPPANLPTTPSVSLPGVASVIPVGTLNPPNIPVSAPVPSAPLSTSGLVPEGYGNLLPLPSQLASVDAVIGAATQKLGESEPMSQQIDTLMAVVTVLGIENPEVYGNMASLDNLGAIEGAASSLNPTDLGVINTLLETLQVPPAQFLYNVVDFVKTIEELESKVTDLKDSVAYMILGTLALS